MNSTGSLNISSTDIIPAYRTPKYFKYSSIPEHRTPKYFKYKQYPEYSTAKYFQAQAVSRVLAPETLEVQAVSRVLDPETLGTPKYLPLYCQYRQYRQNQKNRTEAQPECPVQTPFSSFQAWDSCRVPSLLLLLLLHIITNYTLYRRRPPLPVNTFGRTTKILRFVVSR